MKNKKYRIKKYMFAQLCLVFFSCFFSGCMPVQSTIENLLKAPESESEFSEIKEMLKTVMGDDVVFKYPKLGEYRSPFVSYDINRDGKKEVIVFCSGKNSEETNIKILKKDEKGKKWTEIFSEIAPGVDVKKVLFLKEDGESKFPQIIVNWTKPNKTDNFLTVYTYKNKKIERIYSQDYLTDVLVFDIDNDQKDEIIVIDRTLQITPNIGILRLMKNGSELEKKSYVRLIPGVIECKKVEQGKLSKNKNALFLDIEGVDRYDRTFWCTEIIAVDQKNSLVNLSYKLDENSELDQSLLSQSMRGKKIGCRDINQDSIIEIPKDLKYRYNYRSNKNEKLQSLIVWQRYLDGNFEFVNLSVENVDDKYSFVFPKTWFLYNQDQDQNQNNITPLVVVYYDNINKELIFKNNDDSLDEIMRIKVVDKSQQSPEGYDEIITQHDCIYCVKINNQNNNFDLKLKDVQQNFVLEEYK